MEIAEKLKSLMTDMKSGERLSFISRTAASWSTWAERWRAPSKGMDRERVCTCPRFLPTVPYGRRCG